MKKIFHLAITGFLCVMVACNDSSNDTTTDANNDTTAVAPETSAPPENNVITQKGLLLGADQEVPANTSKGSGTADVTYNKDTKMLGYTVHWTGLTGKATMAHIHGTAPVGTNAGVKHDLSNVLQKEAAGTFTDSVKIDASGITEDSLLSGLYYFNIHTAANPGGEIRGQIEFK